MLNGEGIAQRLEFFLYIFFCCSCLFSLPYSASYLRNVFGVTSSSIRLLYQVLTPSFGILSRQIFHLLERTFLCFSKFILCIKTSATSCSVYAIRGRRVLASQLFRCCSLMSCPEDSPDPTTAVSAG